ncbi:hypothetical protein E2C01_089768 [Portunus trituberculatus]|uniref:Uncharacterized protein n=1 Tax=Portunus trituberculatus TaxID=210409 RepID=A0A5B7JEH3_PORTR|nr:hypothetical protein [Portunus trituberculatus]
MFTSCPTAAALPILRRPRV